MDRAASTRELEDALRRGWRSRAIAHLDPDARNLQLVLALKGRRSVFAFLAPGGGEKATEFVPRPCKAMKHTALCGRARSERSPLDFGDA